MYNANLWQAIFKHIQWSIFDKENNTLPQSYLKNDNDMSLLMWKDFQDMLLTFENQALSKGAWETKKMSPTFAWANWFKSSKPWYKNVDPELRRGKWVFEESKVVRVHKTEYQSRKSSTETTQKTCRGAPSAHAMETSISTG